MSGIVYPPTQYLLSFFLSFCLSVCLSYSSFSLFLLSLLIILFCTHPLLLPRWYTLPPLSESECYPHNTRCHSHHYPLLPFLSIVLSSFFFFLSHSSFSTLFFSSFFSRFHSYLDGISFGLSQKVSVVCTTDIIASSVAESRLRGVGVLAGGGFPTRSRHLLQTLASRS